MKNKLFEHVSGNQFKCVAETVPPSIATDGSSNKNEFVVKSVKMIRYHDENPPEKVTINSMDDLRKISEKNQNHDLIVKFQDGIIYIYDDRIE